MILASQLKYFGLEVSMVQVEGCDLVSLDIFVRNRPSFCVPFFFVIHCIQLQICTISILLIFIKFHVSEQMLLFLLYKWFFLAHRHWFHHSAIDTIIKQRSLSERQHRRARRQYTSRVHVQDICQALKACIQRPSSR